MFGIEFFLEVGHPLSHGADGGTDLLFVVLSQSIEDVKYSPRVLQKFEVGRVPIDSGDIFNPAVQGGPPMFGVPKQSRKIEQ